MFLRRLACSGAAVLITACSGSAELNRNVHSELTSRIPPLTGPYAAPRNCTENYIGVPGDPDKIADSGDQGILGFCISKFEMKHPSDQHGRFIVTDSWSGAWNWRPDVTSIPEAKSVSRPWILISYQEALDACTRIKAPGFTYTLVSSDEWDVLAENISGTPENWSLGAVDSGELARGFRILDTRKPDDATYIRNTVCAWRADPRGFCPAPLFVSQIWNEYSDMTTSLGNSETERFVQKRTHLLSNGQTIWDFGGNVSEWVLQPSNEPTAFARGGHFADVSTGIFTRFDVVPLPDDTADKMHSSEPRQTSVGFRCVAHPVR